MEVRAGVVKILDQCRAAGVPFFFKQWGGVRKSETGRILAGRTFDDMPQRKTQSIASRGERLGLIQQVRRWAAHGPSVEDVTEGGRQALLF